MFLLRYTAGIPLVTYCRYTVRFGGAKLTEEA
jgi:hypothetical protein